MAENMILVEEFSTKKMQHYVFFFERNGYPCRKLVVKAPSFKKARKLAVFIAKGDKSLVKMCTMLKLLTKKNRVVEVGSLVVSYQTWSTPVHTYDFGV